MLRLFLLLSILLFSPINAMAIEINDAGAQKLKSSFQELLDYQKTSNEAFGSLKIIYGGELTVEQNPDYYTITLPHISIQNIPISEDEKEFTLDIGVITMNAMPDDKPEYWKVSLSLPSKVTLSDDTDKDLVIAIKEQRAIALFNDRLGYFTKADIALTDISVTEGGKDTGFSLGDIKFYSNMNEGESGKFSGSGYISLGGLSISSPDKESSAKIGEVKFDFNMVEFNLLTLKEYSNKLSNHEKTFSALSDLDEHNINSDDVIEMISDLYDFEMDGFSFNYDLKDFRLVSEKDSKDFDDFNLGSAFFGFGLDGLNSEKGSLHINTGYNDVNISPIDTKYGELLPKNVNFDIKATNVPYPQLSQMAANTAKSIAKNPDGASMAGLSVLMRLPAILSQSDAEIIFEKNGIKNDVYGIILDGNIATDLAAIMSFSAKFRVVFDGLDKVLSIAKKDELMPIISKLEKFKEIGKNDSGNDSYVFEIETTPEGKILVNGQDTSTISSGVKTY